jgi:putative sterol carrier protein
MVDIEALKEKWMPKLEAQDLKFEELKEVLELMVGVANDNEDFADEYGSFTKTYQFNVSDKPEAEWMWMKIESGKFSAGMGKLPKYDLQFSMNAQVAADMISGKLDSNSAFIKGDLKIDGQIKDGVKFQGIMALFKDVMDL